MSVRVDEGKVTFFLTWNGVEMAILVVCLMKKVVDQNLAVSSLQRLSFSPVDVE